MGAVNFYLKSPEPSGQSLIYLQFKFRGQKLVFSFGQTIEPKKWDKKKQRVKSVKETALNGKFYLNDLLDNLERECKTIYNSLLRDGNPTPEEIKKGLTAFMNSSGAPKDKPNLFSLILRFVNNEIGERKYNTVRSYKTTYNHLQEFSRATKTVTDFDNVTLDYYYRFVAYLKKQGLSSNSVGKEIKNLKTFMGEAVDMGYTNNLQFRHKKFEVTREETDAVYLSWKEILKLYRHDLSTNKRLEAVRDLFIFGCCTGLRYSDYSKVNPENIIQDGADYWIQIKTQKTGEIVNIPCHPLVIELFAKYRDQKNTLPRAVSNQKFNDYIKEACKEVGFTTAGRLATKPALELWQCISSHTARRSFATNYYLEGFPVIELMKITGHRTEKSLLRYIKISRQDAGRKLQAHIKNNWSEKLLKVAS